MSAPLLSFDLIKWISKIVLLKTKIDFICCVYSHYYSITILTGRVDVFHPLYLSARSLSSAKNILFEWFKLTIGKNMVLPCFIDRFFPKNQQTSQRFTMVTNITTWNQEKNQDWPPGLVVHNDSFPKVMPMIPEMAISYEYTLNCCCQYACYFKNVSLNRI